MARDIEADGRIHRQAERRDLGAEFRAETVRLAAERRAAGASLAQVGHELNVQPHQLRACAQPAPASPEPPCRLIVS